MSSVIDVVSAAMALGESVRPQVGGFPYLAEAMRQAGITKNFFDVSSASTVFVTGGGDVLVPGAMLHSNPVVVPPFDEAALVAALRVDQEGECSFEEFVEAIFRAGVIRFEVDTADRSCTYFGAHGEQYVERYSAVVISSS